MRFATAAGLAVYDLQFQTWTDYSASLGDFPANEDNFAAVAVGPDGKVRASATNGTLWGFNGTWTAESVSTLRRPNR